MEVPTIAADTLASTLAAWVEAKSQNLISQHSEEWLQAKVNTIGGSSIGTIMGLNPYSNIYSIISDKIGLTEFKSNIKMQWGNLFEDVIKRYVEHDTNCIVYGEDLYMEFSGGCAYSPDGLAVMDITCANNRNNTIGKGSPQIVLLEFKCPYSRLPAGRPPAYYVAQVKMGLCLLDLPTVGLLAESVFRRCTWEQLGLNDQYDTTLIPNRNGDRPLAYGVIGFYCADINLVPARLNKNYDGYYVEKGDASNGFQCSDLGDSPPQLFIELMDAVDKKIIMPWYGSISYGDSLDEVNADKEKFTQMCADNNFTNFGILGWKLFSTKYTVIEKTEGYLDPWKDKICEILEVVKQCNEADADKKLNIYTSYINRNSDGGFSDDHVR